MEQVLEFLRTRAGHDFGSYKRSTQHRRIYRRQGLRNIETLGEYIDELRTNPEEVQTLVADLRSMSPGSSAMPKPGRFSPRR
ncbi:hypothetical protein [Rhizobium mongolense]